MTEAEFDNEAELELWVKSEFSSFLPASILLNGFSVSTASGKRGVPDGFAFDFSGRAWYVIECELLTHGVWNHIAEQMVRFVVAMQNPSTLRVIRDRLFEHVLSAENPAAIATELDTKPDRLIQAIELFIEAVQPHFVIFIDQTNRDLEDMVRALNAPASIYRVQKFIVGGATHYHSADRNDPAVQSEPEERGVSHSDLEVIELLGGGEFLARQGRFRCYRLASGEVVHIKRSKHHERGNYYWYGVNPSTLQSFDKHAVTHLIFVMGDYGFSMVPLQTVTEYIKHTKTSSNPDGSIRHYHFLISHNPEPQLFWSNDFPKYSLGDCFQPFER